MTKYYIPNDIVDKELKRFNCMGFRPTKEWWTSYMLDSFGKVVHQSNQGVWVFGTREEYCNWLKNSWLRYKIMPKDQWTIGTISKRTMRKK